MIPKIIHYCWFGGQPIPSELKKCINSWENLLSDFKIIRWDEGNSPMDIPFVKQAYKHKKWAFVSDYIRFWALNEYGGIYLDTDIYLLKRFDELLTHSGFIGAENNLKIGCGIIGVIPKHWFIKACMEIYQSLYFDPSFLPIVTNICTRILEEEGFSSANHITSIKDLVIYPPRFFYPYPYPPPKSPNYRKFIQPESITIHLWKSSWHTVWNEFINGRYYRGLIRLYQDSRQKENRNFIYYLKSLYYILALNRLKRWFILFRNKILISFHQNIPFLIFLILKLNYKNKLSILSKIKRNEKKIPTLFTKRLDIKYKLNLKENNDWKTFNLLFPPSTFQFFEKIKHDDNVIDVGANLGFYTLMSAKKAINGKVFSIEPDQSNYVALSKNLSLNGFKNIFPYNLAFGNQNKKVTIETFSHDNNNGMKRIKEVEFSGDSETPMMTLDEFVEINAIDKVNWMKIDIEGYEYEFLKGALQTIAHFKPYIYIEICDLHLKHFKSSASALIKLLEEIGYVVIHAELKREISSKFYLDNCFFDAFCYPKPEYGS